MTEFDTENHALRWTAALQAVNAALGGLSFRNERGEDLSMGEGFRRWAEQGARLREQHRCLYLVGNGASASMSSHFAADISKNAAIHAQVFTDLSLITAIANDLAYDEVFAVPLRRRAQPGDLLVTISSSGNSPNVLKAIDVALELGLQVTTLSAMSGNNLSRRKGHLNIHVPAQTYGVAETAHAAILHHWTDLLVESARSC